MKRTGKILIILGVAIIVVIVGLLAYAMFALPNVGQPENIKVSMTPKNIERGKYLANSVCVCMDCHSKRDWAKFAGPLIVTTMGQGGEEFSQKFGFPGKYYAKNITPYGIRDWSDGEVLRALSCGVSKNGSPLFPVMPYLDYGLLDRSDIYDIIAYIRTLSPIENNIQTSVSDFPMNFIIHTIPQKAIFSTIPDKKKKVAYGEYLFIAASCADCHTPQEKGKPIKGMDLAGGFKLPLVTGGTVVTANITPDVETGIGTWSEEAFVIRFKAYTDPNYIPMNITRGMFNTYMPWTMFATMQTEDLKAIYAYLKTVKPVKNKIIKFTSE